MTILLSSYPSSSGPIGPLTTSPRVVPLGLPRVGTEFVREGSFVDSFRNIAVGLSRGCGLTVGHALSMTTATLTLLVVNAWTERLVLHAPEKMDVFDSSLCLSALFSGVLFAGVGFRQRHSKETVGHFLFVETVAGHAYDIQAADGGIRRIEPRDPVLEIHVDNDAFFRTAKSMPDLEPAKVFQKILKDEIALVMDRAKRAMEDHNIAVLRLWTPLPPKYFKGLEGFLVGRMTLSRKTPSQPSFLKRMAVKAISYCSDSKRLIQMILYYRRRFAAFAKTASLRNLWRGVLDVLRDDKSSDAETFVRSVLQVPGEITARTLPKTFPVRTYLFFQDDLSQIPNLWHPEEV